MKKLIFHNLQAPEEPLVREKYGVNDEVASLGLAIYVLGFAFGPLLCASPTPICLSVCVELTF